MELDSKIFVAGHNGMVGSAILRKLNKAGYNNVFGSDRKYLDLRSQYAVDAWFAHNKPDYVFLTAAKVGGILANSTYPANFIYDNLMIQSNVIDAAYRNGVKKLLFLGSSCIYPKFSEQPIKEEYLLSGYFEPTNKAYAIAKIAGIEMCQSYKKQYGFNAISAIPTNLYGPNDNFDLENSHVIPGMIRKFIEAKENNVSPVMWGTGTPMREFLYVDDLADACVFLMNDYDGEEHINVGSPDEVSIETLANMIKNKVGCKSELVWDISKPDGTPRKKMDTSKLESMGWTRKIDLEKGLSLAINWYLNNVR
jgi:GDP-L-fucose synthase